MLPYSGKSFDLAIRFHSRYYDIALCPYQDTYTIPTYLFPLAMYCSYSQTLCYFALRTLTKKWQEFLFLLDKTLLFVDYTVLELGMVDSE